VNFIKVSKCYEASILFTNLSQFNCIFAKGFTDKKVRSLNRLIPLAPSMRVLVTSDRHRVPLSRIKAIFEVRNHYSPRLANSHKSRYTLVEDCRNNVRVPLITVKI
jgi:hypothetical protein